MPFIDGSCFALSAAVLLWRGIDDYCYHKEEYEKKKKDQFLASLTLQKGIK